MAEFVASLIAIASLGAKVSITLHKAVSTLSSAQNDARLIAADISIFTCTLTQLSKIISNCNVPEAAQLFEIAQVLVPACSALVGELHKLIGNTELYQGAFWTRLLALRFKWLLNGPKVAFIKSLLESFKSTLVLLISTMDLAIVIHQDAQADVKESLKAQVQTNLYLAEDAKANLLLFKGPRDRSDPLAISGHPVDQSTAFDAPYNVRDPIDTPAQSLVQYNEHIPNANASVALGQLPLEEELNGTTCLSECPQELSGILAAQETTMKLAENLLKVSHVPTWTWGSSAATKSTDIPKQAPNAHRVSPSDRLEGSAHMSDSKLPKLSQQKQSPGLGEALAPETRTDGTVPGEQIDPLQYLRTEEDQKSASGLPTPNEIGLQEIIRKVLEETFASRISQATEGEHLGVSLETTTPVQKPTLPKESSKSVAQDDTERMSRLQRFLDQQEEQSKQEKEAEAERKAKKLKSDSDRLKQLEILISAQKEEQVTTEEALEAARKKQAELAKAKKEAAEEAIAMLRYPDGEPPIKFKDAVGRKFSFPWLLCKTWKGMEELIKQAFLHVDGIGPRVQEGHYDLVGPDGEIILPQVWETMVQPDSTITMHMWPMPEVGQPPPPPPPGLPPQDQQESHKKPGKNLEKGQRWKAGLGKLMERQFSSQDSGKA